MGSNPSRPPAASVATSVVASLASTVWGNLIYLSREVVTKTTVALEYRATCEVCKYLCALTWSLRDKLRSSNLSDDILKTLLTGTAHARTRTQDSPRALTDEPC